MVLKLISVILIFEIPSVTFSNIESSIITCFMFSVFSEFDKFGFLFEDDLEPHPCWTFDFTVNFHSVFDDGINDFGYLYSDCEGVPMIQIGTEWNKLPTFLDGSPELRNIYFEEIPDENQ